MGAILNSIIRFKNKSPLSPQQKVNKQENHDDCKSYEQRYNAGNNKHIQTRFSKEPRETT